MADHHDVPGDVRERIYARLRALDEPSLRIVQGQVGRHRIVAARVQGRQTDPQHEASCQAPWIRQNVAVLRGLPRPPGPRYARPWTSWTSQRLPSGSSNCT